MQKHYAKITIFLILIVCVIFVVAKLIDVPSAIAFDKILHKTLVNDFVKWVVSAKSLHTFIIFINKYIYNFSLIMIAICFCMAPTLRNNYTYKFCTSSCLSVVLSGAFKEGLMLIFGHRTPVTINLLTATKHTFEFHLFHGGGSYSSFPSGHMTIICALTASIWLFYPKLRWLSLLFSILMGLSLIIFNYHFVSDVLSGAILGTLTAICVKKIVANN